VLNFFRARSRAWCPKLGELCRGVAPAEHRLLVPVGSEGGNSEGGSGEDGGGEGVGGEGVGGENGGGEGGGDEEGGGEGGVGEGLTATGVLRRAACVCLATRARAGGLARAVGELLEGGDAVVERQAHI
jgi:hypothetical protein